MKPAYWIGILALFGGIVGYGLFRFTGWVGTGTGVVVGILAGVVVYAIKTRKAK